MMIQVVVALKGNAFMIQFGCILCAFHSVCFKKLMIKREADPHSRERNRNEKEESERLMKVSLFFLKVFLKMPEASLRKKHFYGFERESHSG